MKVEVTVQHGDALTFNTDILVLKHAQHLYGADALVVNTLFGNNEALYRKLPQIHQHLLLDTNGKLGAKHVLFVGVKPLYEFKYKEIRDFSRKVLSCLYIDAPTTEHLTLTLHGVGYGLDETEAFESEIAGLMDAITDGHFPKDLKKITIIEIDSGRTRRLNTILNRLLPKGRINIDKEGVLTDITETSSERFREAGYTSQSKPNAFVAMPFDDKLDDVYHYGIQGAVNKAGFLCERADLSSFTGDIMQWVKQRISNTTLLIADLTNANPNVYLEVGYAWGQNKPTILLTQNMNDMKFDIKGQKCLHYKKISELEKRLYSELENLKPLLV